MALSDNRNIDDTVDADAASSKHFRHQLSLFLNYLNFWEDVLEQCKLVSITNTLQKSFQQWFLQQIL